MLRTLDDSLALRAALTNGSPRVVVVGAGFIGSEVAATAHGLGCAVTVVEALPVPLVRALGARDGCRLRGAAPGSTASTCVWVWASKGSTAATGSRACV